MLSVLLLLVLPVALGGLLLTNVFDDDDDDTDTRVSAQDEDTPIADGDVYLENTGAEVLIGGDGVDIYLLDRDVAPEDVPREINLGAGSDIARVDVDFQDPKPQLIRGGAGDDILSNERGVLRGGPGEDVLEGINGMEVFGGQDDDVITVDARGTAFGAAVTTVSGGAGDDEITIIESPGTSRDTNGRVEVTGGSGADTFIIEAVDFFAPDQDGDLDQLIGGGDTEVLELLPYANINDFEPGVDELIIRIGSSTAVVDLDIQPLEQTNREPGVTVSFTTRGGFFEPPQKGSINLFGVPDLTLDDVTFIGGGSAIVSQASLGGN